MDRMPRLPPRRASRSIALFLLTLAASATGRLSAEKHVFLANPVAVTPVAQLPGMLAGKVENLAQIDPDHPVGPDSDLQTLSLFGREDLIAPSSPSYTPTHCAPLEPATPALAEITRRAQQTRIVIINESHERSEHRGFSAQVARALRPLGYDVLALETLSNPPTDVPARYLPSFRVHPKRGYLADDDGHYLSEAGYGRFGRAAKALGYTLFAYEDVREPSPGTTPAEQIATREEAQATVVAAFVATHPRARLLVHVGYSHAAEVPQAEGARWMAARLKQKTGIDPLTISQTTCRGGGAAARLAVLPGGRPSKRALRSWPARMAPGGGRPDCRYPARAAPAVRLARDRGAPGRGARSVGTDGPRRDPSGREHRAAATAGALCAARDRRGCQNTRAVKRR
jgi:hypothetical protein